MTDAIPAAPLVVTALKTVLDTVRGLRAMRSEDAVKAVQADLLGKITDAYQEVLGLQTANESMREQVRTAQADIATLKQELARFQDWHAERKHYQLVALGPDAFVYVKQSDGSSTEPQPHLCASCFRNAEYAILQRRGHESYDRVLACPRCDARVHYRDPGDRFAQVVPTTT